MSEVEGGLDEPEALAPAQGSLDLASPADDATTADWETAAAAVLRKARRMTEDDPDRLVWQKLTRTTLDGVELTPLGTSALLDDVTTSGRPTRSGDWDVRTHVSGTGARLLNEIVLTDLQNGATSLWLSLGSSTDSGRTDLGIVLDEVLLDLAPVVLDAPLAPLATAQAFLALARQRDVTPAAGTNLGADPVAARVRGVSTGSSDESGYGDLVAVAELALEAGMLGVVVDATAVHDLGASDAQELGYSMAVGAAYLRQLTEAGIAVDDALGLVEFRYSATDEQFATIAKLRAARRLWARVAELSGASAESTHQRQHVVTSRPMMSRYDPWVNMLRTTVAAFAAGVGGAEAVTVLPFDSPLGTPDAFGRRIGRNTSSLLISESHVARVADPAGGAYAVEALTDSLAHAGWAELGRIEESGGILAALDDGSLRTRIDEVVARREAQIAVRERPLTGLSEFPNPGEVLPEREPDDTATVVRRYGASFEALRDEPVGHVHLAAMGTVAAHTARVTFASNLFAAGGVTVGYPGPLLDVDEVLTSYDGQPVVCLCGSDAAYADWGAQLIAALRANGAEHVIIAGKAGDLDVDDSCAVGVDALAFLTRTREKAL